MRILVVIFAFSIYIYRHDCLLNNKTSITFNDNLLLPFPIKNTDLNKKISILNDLLVKINGLNEIKGIDLN